MAGRKAAADRREELLAAAVTVTTRKGFAAATLRDVAGEAGVAHGLLRHYFPSRDAMLAAAFDRAAHDEVVEVGPGLDPVAALAALCRPGEEQHYLLWVDAWSEAPRSPDLAATLRRHHLDCEEVTRRVLADGRAAGRFSCDDPGTAARSLTALLDGLAVQLFALRLIDAAEHQRLAHEHAERLVGLPAGALAAAHPPG